MNQSLLEAAKQVQDSGLFLGGTIGSFESHGRNQFLRLLRHGLNPDSRLLDIGCGCLRGGYWTIRFLEPHCYCGIEPNQAMLNAGKSQIVGPEILTTKQPRFDGNDCFDFSVFGGEPFDFFMAGSIWTHAARHQIEAMMDGFASFSHQHGVFLGSFVRTNDGGYQGKNWVGKSHQSDEAGLVSHRFETLCEIASQRGLVLEHLTPNIRGKVSWLKMTRQTTEAEAN